jgi:predicted nucleic acid-binding protein
MFAIDTNLLIYAYNTYSEFHKEASIFLEKVMNEYDEEGNLLICLPLQVLMEFINVITRQNIKNPLSLDQAIRIVEEYQQSEVKIIYPQETQLTTFLQLIKLIKTRKKVFDVVLAATLKDNGISGLYTVNTGDFVDFNFLKVENPFK